MKNNETFETARRWMYRYARPLHLALWQYHFEGGSQEAVLKALACFQNPDGGFAHGLESDNRNPNSNPIAVWQAVGILTDIGLTDTMHPIVQGIVHYLESGADFENDRWLNTVPSNNVNPCAPWWNYQEDATQTSYNPTAALAGFLLLHATKGTALQAFASRITGEACQALLNGEDIDDDHAVAVYGELLAFISQAGLEATVPYAQAQLQWEQSAAAILQRDVGKWDTYTCRPSRFIHKAEDALYPALADLVGQEVAYLLQTQRADGSWPVYWNWCGLYPDVWPIAEQESKGAIVLENCLFLKSFL